MEFGSNLKRFCHLLDDQHRNDDTERLEVLLDKPLWTVDDRQLILKILTTLLCDEKLSEFVAFNFASILKELFSRIEPLKIPAHQVFIALSKLIGHYQDAIEFAVKYFENNQFSPFVTTKSSKKRKSSKLQVGSPLKTLIASFNYLWFDYQRFKDLWDWSPLFGYLNSDDRELRWVAMQCVRIICAMSDKHFYAWTSTIFTSEDECALRIKFNYLFKSRNLKLAAVSNFDNQSTDHCLEVADFGDDTIPIHGILLSKVKTTYVSQAHNKVVVPSFENYVKTAALSVSFGEPVLLQGPVGCGKTSLVEYLAHCTNRINPPHLTKLQIGDQIDGKLLIGTHCCTDIPGEFVWKAGPLTECLVNGHWLLLEDIDCAPPDVISILSSVIKTKSLSSLVGCPVTKHKANENFRIFFTRRLVGNHIETHRSAMGNFYKLCNIISMEVMPRKELETVITTLWPELIPVVEKTLDIYYLMQESNDSEMNNYFMSLSRTVSVRDLFKWCTRISESFCLNSDETALNIFLSAADCFFQSLPTINNRVTFAEKIGPKLNITAVTSRSLICQRKPDLHMTDNCVKIGRVTLSKKCREITSIDTSRPFFAYTQQSLSLLEKIAVCVYYNEPVLLVGETGTGKTSSIQYLAHLLHTKLSVINMNQQSDSCDLLGGYKPVDFKLIVQPLRVEFEDLFSMTFNTVENAKFLTHISDCFQSRKWSTLFSLISHVQKKAIVKELEESAISIRWNNLGTKINRLQSIGSDNPVLGFAYVEGSLVKAMTSGEWILLDEINLAETETLQCLSSLFDSNDDSFVFVDKADGLPIKRHSDFRIFACMNPATDVGKKELPLGIRNRFTEFYVEELVNESDLQILVNTYLEGCVSPPQISKIVKFYLKTRQEAENNLCDTNGSRPHYSLRTLCRALRVCSSNPCGSIQKSLYESFSLSFLTQLNWSSHVLVESLISNHLLEGKNASGIKKSQIPKPSKENDFVLCEGYWISKGPRKPFVNVKYILTSSVRKNLKDLARIVSLGKTFPILLQGETSVGKTSVIQWLAQATGNICVRVNNHEHTDLQEYVGSYCVNSSGKLQFKEGILVEAMKKGFWIILDELNLASTEVLEALNRVLDDNRELFISETQEIVKAHPKFILFATQNPPETYGGRKVLSRAFRNRFVELHFDEIPSKELELILHEKCCLPLSYAKKMVSVLCELRVRRRESGIFDGKHGFITLRDLFRWGERYQQFAEGFKENFYDWDQYLAHQGYMLLAGRVRRQKESDVVLEVIETVFKRKVIPAVLFNTYYSSVFNNDNIIPKEFSHLVWTENLKRLAILMIEALNNKEPVLLIGETGCGKTTISQLFAAFRSLSFYSVNCHMHSESADFLGSLRPVRHRSENDNRLFEWVDGPLIEAMKSGGLFLVDEISLADDSVLERLNSVLEPDRCLLLTERVPEESASQEKSIIVAEESFRFVATMNPGGDYGKKELSPALRNRFTEIWCSSDNDIQDFKAIVEHNLCDWLTSAKSEISEVIAQFFVWLNMNNSYHNSSLSIRDILSAVQFINKVTDASSVNPLPYTLATFHAISLVFIDSVGTGNSSQSKEAKMQCDSYLKHLLNSVFQNYNEEIHRTVRIDPNEYFGIDPFYIPTNRKFDEINVMENPFIFESPSASSNTLKLLRGMQITKPILLEGVPGVGKTSLVLAMAKATGNDVVRINLSEQTDISDLFGADLPVEGSEGVFSWRDGPLLQALKKDKTWIVLDELNLASQSVLEGLNACLDHRGEIYVPELSRSFTIEKHVTRIFACQNPHRQGGSRKGLPRSFLNRFTVVLVDTLTNCDLEFIISRTFPEIPHSTIQKMVSFNQSLVKKLENHEFHDDFQCEFNLRDLFRWCQLLLNSNFNDASIFSLDFGMDLIFAQRFRNAEDRKKVFDLFEEIFTVNLRQLKPDYNISQSYFCMGNSLLERISFNTPSTDVRLLHRHVRPLEFLMKCIEMNWMSILTGTCATEKANLVSVIASITGHSLKVMSVNPEMDAIDLLGGFEQQDLITQFTVIENQTWKLVQNAIQLSVTVNEDNSFSSELFHHWYKCVHSTRKAVVVDNGSLLEMLRKLEIVLQHISAANFDCNSVLLSLKNLKSRCTSRNLSGNGIFEWVDSVLVKALRDGEWLLIDDANLCSASVLDRLNGLLEPGGVLILSEKGVVDGQLSVIRPHPDFRLILAMDPANGELSRAMKNRGVEIHINPPISNHDLQVKLKAIGFENADVVNHLLLLYQKFKCEDEDEIRSEENFLTYCSRIANELHRNSVGNLLVSHTSSENIDSHLSTEVLNLYSDVRLVMGDVTFAKVLQDSYSLKCHDTENFRVKIVDHFSKMEIFLGRSSICDFVLRKMISVKLFGNDTVYANYFQTIMNDITRLIGTNVMSFKELPMEYQSSNTLWNNLSLKLMSEKKLDKVEKLLNRWSLVLFILKLRRIESSQEKQPLVCNRYDASDSSFKHEKFFSVVDFIYTKCLDLNPINDDLLLLKEILYWFHHLHLLCRTDPSPDTSDDFLSLWFLVNEKCLPVAMNFIKLENEVMFSDISKYLNLNCSDDELFYRKISKFNASLSLFNCEVGSELFKQLTIVSDLILSIPNQREIYFDCYAWLTTVTSFFEALRDRFKHENIREELTKLSKQIKSLQMNCKKEDEESEDYDLTVSLRNREITVKSILIPLQQICFNYTRVFDIVNDTNTALNLNEQFNLLLNPLHLYLLREKDAIEKYKNVALLYYFQDFHRLLKKTSFDYWLAGSDDSVETVKTDDQGLSVECSMNVALICTKIISNSNAFGVSRTKLSQLKTLQKFLCYNYSVLTSMSSLNLLHANRQSILDWCLFAQKCSENADFIHKEMFEEAVVLLNGEDSISSFGHAFCLIGLASSHLFAPLTSIDPVLRNNCKLKHYELELSYINTELLLRSEMCRDKIGEDVTSLGDVKIMQLLKRKAILENKIAKAKSKYRHRRGMSQFNKLRHSVKHFLNTILEVDSFVHLVALARNREMDTSNAQSCVRKLIRIQLSMTNFCDQLLTSYPLYYDLLNNFLVGVYITIEGLKVLTHEVKNELLLRNWNVSKEIELTDCLITLGSFSTCDPLKFTKKILNVVSWVSLHFPDINNVYPKTFLNLFKCAFLEMQNCVFLGECSYSVTGLMSAVLNAFLKSWKCEEEKRLAKKAEEEALYEYKTQSFKGELTEEEQEKLDIANKFPTFIEEYEDFVSRDVINDDTRIQSEKVLVSPSQQSSEIIEIFTLHLNVVQGLKKELSSAEPDFVKSFKYRYQLFSDLLKYGLGSFGANIERNFIEGHLIMCDQALSSNNVHHSPEKSNHFNIYEDCLPQELNECLEVLKVLEKRIFEILSQFPGQPSLRRLLQIIDRMYGFSVEKSSVMKYLTGLEILLEASNEWETKAHKGISLRSELNEVTNLILKWRKMELNNWSFCLDSVNRKIREKQLLKWWFHFYDILTSIVNESDPEKDSLISLISSLKQFIENSKIGEFHVRLELLKNFLLHVEVFDNRFVHKSLLNVLYNIYNFYEQFENVVLEKISKEKAPIEKEMKDFVKIMRWNDANFYAVKAAVEKSHKSLHRFTKNYEKALSQPSLAVFKINESKMTIKRPWQLVIDEPFNIECKFDDFNSSEKYEYLSKAKHYFNRATKLSKRISNCSQHLKAEVNYINDFAVNVIETLKDFEKQELPSQTVDKEKWKKAVRQLHHSKQQSLSELWKELAKCGVSYRKGLLSYSTFDLDNIFLELSSIPESGLSTTCQEDMRSSNSYFYACLARYVSLRRAMETPTKDLSRNQFDRIKGVSGHLMSLITTNRKILAKELENISKIKKYLQRFDSQQKIEIVNQKKTFHFIETVKKLVIELKSSVHQFKNVISCHRESDDDAWLLTGKNASLCSTEDERNLLYKTMTDACQRLNNLPLHLLPDFSPEIVLYNSDVEQLKLIYSELEDVVDVITSMLKALNFNFSERENLFLTPYNLFQVCSKVKAEISCFEIDIETNVAADIDDILVKGQRLFTCLLLTIETLFKRKCDKLQQVNEEKSDLFSGVIVKCCEMSEICESLRSEKILQNLRHFILAVRSFEGNTTLFKRVSDALGCLNNFLEQYALLCNYFFSLFVACQRSINKLSYILLGLFNGLCERGFCLPQEIDDSNNPAGTKFENITDGGFGEGEGVKDASEKIESEDQLEDTFKEGHESEEKSDNDKDIQEEDQGVEMSNDFDAKTFSPKTEDATNEKEDKSDEEDEEDDELDKKMGDVGDADETIDERLWGDDEEDEEEPTNDSENKGGGEDKTDTEIVAKDNLGHEENHEDKNNEKNPDSPGNDEEVGINDIEEQIQNDEYAGESQDPYKDSEMFNKEQEPEELPDEMELDTNECEGDAEEIPMDEEAENNDLDTEMEEPADVEMPDEDNNADEQLKTESESEIEKDDTSDAEDTKNPISNDAIDEKDVPLDNEDKAVAENISKESNTANYEDLNVDNSAVDEPVNKDDANSGRADAEIPSAESEGIGKTTTYSEEAGRNNNEKPPEQSKIDKQSLTEYNQENLKRRSVLEASDRQTVKPDSKIENDSKSSDLFQHLNNDEVGEEQVIDLACEDEQNKYRPNKDDEEGEKVDANEENTDKIEDTLNDVQKVKEQEAKNVSTKKKHKNFDETEPTFNPNNSESYALDAEVVKDTAVSRGPQSSIHTQSELMFHEFRKESLDSWFERVIKVESESCSVKDKEEEMGRIWCEVELKVNHLLRELCQQLQLVLEPTKTSKLKGDYKTGKRLNMRKVIAYIASQFRKDKIWLRRTKPSKREYQIVIAVDDSSSMADNQSKQLAFESLALLAKSLSLIEAGELAVMSFGEEAKLLHSFDEPFTTTSGAKLFYQFQFNQHHTRVTELLNKTLSLLMTRRRATNAELSQLLLIISDGRGLFNEGEDNVRQAVRRMKTFGVFVVFLVLDNPCNKDSILDIRVPVFDESGNVTIETYMEKFPFPFYLILRDINSMPHILGEALRQWFELVTSSDR